MNLKFKLIYALVICGCAVVVFDGEEPKTDSTGCKHVGYTAENQEVYQCGDGAVNIVKKW